MRSPWWQRGTGWHLDGAAVSLSMTDRLQLGDPDKCSRSRSTQRPGCQPFNSSPPESASQPIWGSRYSVYSPAYLRHSRRAEPSLTISSVFISTTRKEKKNLIYLEYWIIPKPECAPRLTNQPVRGPFSQIQQMWGVFRNMICFSFTRTAGWFWLMCCDEWLHL